MLSQFHQKYDTTGALTLLFGLHQPPPLPRENLSDPALSDATHLRTRELTAASRHHTNAVAVVGALGTGGAPAHAYVVCGVETTTAVLPVDE